MTAPEAQKLKVGDRVIWEGNPKDQGTVAERNWCSFTVTWDNGKAGTLDFRDAGPVSKASTQA